MYYNYNNILSIILKYMFMYVYTKPSIVTTNNIYLQFSD